MAKPKTPLSLSDFTLEKKRAGCPICRLSIPIRQQLAEARSRKIPRAVQVEWLRLEYGIKVTGADFDTHCSARHERI